jgi:hypothetical protein
MDRCVSRKYFWNASIGTSGQRLRKLLLYPLSYGA